MTSPLERLAGARMWRNSAGALPLCESDTVLDELLTQFTVSNIRAVDAALAAQLAPWPTFRESYCEIDQGAASPITVTSAARCRRIFICIQSRRILSSASHTRLTRRSGLHRSRGEFG